MGYVNESVLNSIYLLFMTHILCGKCYIFPLVVSPAVVIWVQGALVTLASTKTALVELQVTSIAGCWEITIFTRRLHHG